MIDYDLESSLPIIKFEINIKENCPAGCPCNTYECEDFTPTTTSTTSAATTATDPNAKDAVLMLSTYKSNNVPMVIEYNGKNHLIKILC